MSRKEHVFKVTKRLIILTATAAGGLGLVFALSLFLGQKLMISWACLLFGILGGFVSIQQRLNKLDNKDLELLSENMFQILLIPIYGGIFACILYLVFLAQIMNGPLFPAFTYIEYDGTSDLFVWVRRILTETHPSTTQDFAKLFLWSFVAGFSERFVPQVLSNMVIKVVPDKE